jgi:histidine triad (HIT) family protein
VTIFAKILAGEIPADVVFEDEHCMVFRDINPVAPQHLLVIPRKPLVSLADATADDESLLGHLLVAAATVADQLGFGEDGYRLVTNIGRHGGQSVFHLHIHLLGGRQLLWPPG